MICLVFEGVPIEKINLLKAYGAIVIECGIEYEAESSNGYVGIARMLSKEIPNVHYLDQFNNANNILAHYETTGPEIWTQMNKRVDYFFSAIGTGGTISGVGKFLKERDKKIKVIGVEPIGGLHKSYFYDEKGEYKVHIVPSLSDDFVSPNFKKDYVDDVVQVDGKKAFEMCFEILRTEGLSIGTSGGCAIKAIKDYIYANKISEDKNIVCVIADNGLKYMDTLYNKDYLKSQKIEFPELTNENKELLNRIKKICKEKGLQYQLFKGE